MKTINSELQSFEPIIRLSRILPRSVMQRLRIVFFCVFLISITTFLATFIFSLALPLPLWFGISLLFFGLWLEQVLLYCYHNSFYFRGFDSIRNSANKIYTGLTYRVALILLSNKSDIVSGFWGTAMGKEIIERCEITPEAISAYLTAARMKLAATEVPLQSERMTTVVDIATYIYMYDSGFRTVCTQAGCDETMFLATTRFVTKTHEHSVRKQRWWGRDQLSRLGALGSALSEGIPYELQEFSKPLSRLPADTETGSTSTEQKAAIEKIEVALARSRAANVLLIGNPGVGTLGIIAHAAKKITRGGGLNALRSLHFSVLDIERLMAKLPEATQFELMLHRILSGAARAGNHAIIIPNLSQVLLATKARGVDMTTLLDSYLTLPTLHLLATDSPDTYHQHLENNALFIRRFEEILIEPASVEETITILEPLVIKKEAYYGIRFTYAAIAKIASGSERYLTVGDMPERAIQFLSEVAEIGARSNTKTITETYVGQLLGDKTGIPTGPVTDTERDQLLHLEDVLHTRIVGQDAAITALAKTMRRARVSIERADKPIGSFLFLGPTGVGKTETAKALAYVFFGDETALVRFDMSEYSNETALAHLIGDDQNSGVLTDAFHEHPYAVVLFDEFEKAHQMVHDLFLQILDEGFFTSHRGERVNVRNTILIATSNAGSDLIARTKNSRGAAPALEIEIIAGIIKAGIFRPELINRFDNTIIFESLTRPEQEKIAALLLRDLTARVAKEGYTLEIEPELISHISEAGYDEQFGARAMGRVIQDTIEDAIASRIISGTIKSGDVITLGLRDIKR